MDSGNVEGDRLSSLPDDLIHKILSFLSITDAIKTSVLSSRWRFIWTSMPCLNFSNQDFAKSRKFSKFVTRVLSGRDNRTDVYSVKLSFRGNASHVTVKRILKYAFSHNIQQLNVVFLHENNMEFPLSLLSSLSLKHLSLTMRDFRPCFYSYTGYLSSTWELPSLTTLDLHYVVLCDGDNAADNCVGVFSKCANLKNLTLKGFKTIGSNGFSICHPRLSNLTLENIYFDDVKVVNVVTPQLENLTIRYCHAEHVISAPHLASLLYKGPHPLHLSTDGFRSLEKADICVSCPQETHAHQIVHLLQHLHTVKFLTLNLEIVEVLSSSAELLLHQPSPFMNLKSLNIYPDKKFWSKLAPKKVAMSTEVKSYLLDSSPKSTFTMVLREEIKAKEIMAELVMILEKEKDNNANTTGTPTWSKRKHK